MGVEKIMMDYTMYKEASLKGRYITQKMISPLLDKWAKKITIEHIGDSENNRPIHLIKLGTGGKKLLLWSQMHGNESTTTKVIFDVLNLLSDNRNPLANDILNKCTLYIIPILNPDGAFAYTRINYNKIDLNRDAQDLTQVESRIFKRIVDSVEPLVAFNLHGQRTIFSAGETDKSAIVSFLSPASDVERTVTESRKRGMRIIAEMDKALQEVIPGCVGRYDDGFNINCTGDTMEFKGYTTLLFEAGHYPNDYDREKTRELIYLSLVTALGFVANNPIETNNYEDYFKIPENGKLFNDIILRNLSKNGEVVDVAIQYEERLINKELHFIPKIAKIQSFIKEKGHLEWDGKHQDIQFSNVLEKLNVGDELDYLSIENEKFSVFPIKK